MGPEEEQSLGDGATFAGHGQSRPHRADVSLGDERTLSDNISGQDTVLDDIEVVDLEARYKIEGTLGQGGMGAVLLATDTRLDRKVAIKRILGEAARSKTAIARFLTEAKAIAALNHPNIVQIYDYGRAKDGPFLIMEYVDGGSLADRCKQGGLPLEEAVELACQLCDGLAKAHDAGIVHRDIKPANVLLNGDDLPKLTDFGLAKAEAADHGMTMTGAVMGTPDFMPPEQRRDASEVDHRSDLWSLAATVYQMVTGRSPKIIRFNDIPAALQDVLAKALEDRKDGRYQSAREFRDALKTSLRAATTVEAELIEGQCPACGVKNESSRRFCRGCGESLETPCLSCVKPMPMWEEICGACGAKQTPLLEERRQSMAAKQAEAEGLLGDFEFEKAAAFAERLRDEPHQKLKHLSGWAAKFLASVEQAREERTRQAVEAIAEAGKHEAAHDYLSAALALEAVPAALRGSVLAGAQEPAASVIARVQKKQAEVRRLDAMLKERLAAKQLDELLPTVDRLLALQPNREDVTRIRTQLVERAEKQTAARDEAVAAARACLENHDYEGAVAALAGVAAAVATPEVVTLREQAEGLLQRVRGLLQTIKKRIATKDLDGLLGMVEQYLKLKPADADVGNLRQTLVAREEKLGGEIATRLEQAKQLEQACRFNEAAKLLAVIPESRRLAPVAAVLERTGRLGALRQTSIESLSKAASGTYGEAIEASRPYRDALAEATITDAEFATLLSKAETAYAEEVRLRRILYVTGMTAAGIAAAIVVCVSWLWMQASAREASLGDAIAQGRWDDALAITPLNPRALVGRALQKLQATPADIEGAFADLEKAERQPGAGAIVDPVRAEAHAIRAASEAEAGRLDRAVEDLRTAVRGGANQAVVTPAQAAIARSWLARAAQAAAKGEGTVVRTAVNAALTAGVDRTAALELWRDYVKGRIEKLDGQAIEFASAELKKAGLGGADERGWWILYGTTAASPPHENAAEIIRAVNAALAAGASAADVVQLRAKALVCEALAAQKKGDSKSAASAMAEASLLDAAIVRATLMNPARAALRTVVVANYRRQFDAAVARKDWERALQVGAAAETVDKSAGEWMAAALASLSPGALASLSPGALASLPPDAILKLPSMQNSVGMELKLLPAGRFTMGESEGQANETPHQVTLTRPFYMGVYEVTNAQWKRVMEKAPRTVTEALAPVEQVSWEDAMEFCKKLSALPEERKAGREYRLPTEAEWEYACRAGTTTKYSSGDDASKLGDHAWFDGNAGGQTHPVGRKKPNAWGLYDMHGNVWEWCSDWYGRYGSGSATDPQGATKASVRVLRGGCWRHPAALCRSARRGAFDPSDGNDDLGFRIALSPPGVKSVWPQETSASDREPMNLAPYEAKMPPVESKRRPVPKAGDPSVDDSPEPIDDF